MAAAGLDGPQASPRAMSTWPRVALTTCGPSTWARVIERQPDTRYVAHNDPVLRKQAHGSDVCGPDAEGLSERSSQGVTPQAACGGCGHHAGGSPAAAGQPPGGIGRRPGRTAQHRVNDHWRLCFVWRDGDAYDV